MTTKKYSKMRIMRMYVKWKNDILVRLMGLLGVVMLSVGLYYVGFWTVYGIRYCYHAIVLDDLHDSYNYSMAISEDLCFYENGAHSYVKDVKTGKKVLKDVSWLSGIGKKDSLMCFSKKGYRGFLNRNNGQVVIPADHYRKAWVFSEGVAAVMEQDSVLKFINPEGEVVIDKEFRYAPLPEGQGYLFKNGYCPIMGKNHRWGLIDMSGKWTVIPEYDSIIPTLRYYWVISKDGKQGLLDEQLAILVKPTYRRVLVANYGIELLNGDYTRQLMDFDGTIQEGNMYTDVRDLYYKSKVTDPTIDEYEWELSPFKVYQTTYSSEDSLKVGLLGPDGKPVTPPIYLSIEALGADCFRCFYDVPGHYYEGEGLSVLIDKNGRVIKQ